MSDPSVYRLAQARRPEQEEPEPVEEFADQALAVTAGREIIRETTWRGEGPNYVEVRWRDRVVWCGWVRPENLISVAGLFDEHVPLIGGPDAP